MPGPQDLLPFWCAREDPYNSTTWPEWWVGLMIQPYVGYNTCNPVQSSVARLEPTSFPGLVGSPWGWRDSPLVRLVKDLWTFYFDECPCSVNLFGVSYSVFYCVSIVSQAVITSGGLPPWMQLSAQSVIFPPVWVSGFWCNVTVIV